DTLSNQTFREYMTHNNASLPNPSNTNQDTLPLGEGRGGAGRLLIFSAPSGSGKSTIVNWLMKEHPELNLHFSVSCTTRAPRGNEKHGVEYFFLTPDEFKAKIAENAFVEYEEVYTDKFYGTLKSQVETQTERGENVTFDVDVKGGCNIKKMYGEQALSVFIQPPSVEELRRRLVGRATDAPEVIEQRLAKAEYELTFAEKFDVVIVNDDLEKAENETLKAIENFLSRS
ncbi:MAG: guanylate kinase, partial [Prevotella sp.]|nr:guanylate kinase [Prevotella sp.]